ncbi:replication protein A 70 kDa DNA-binding subunit B, partial [Tanacetum coccineum]
GNWIECIIKKDDINKFEALLEVRRCYWINDFGVEEKKEKHPPLIHKYKIVFSKNTILTRIEHFDQNLKGFKFETFTNFNLGRINEVDIVGIDIIGTIFWIRDLIHFADLFNNWASKKETCGHVVLIVQLGKVKYWNGVPSIGTVLYSSKLYINDDILEIRTYNRYQLKDGYDENNFKIASMGCIIKHVKWSRRATLCDGSGSSSKASGSGSRKKFWLCDSQGQLNAIVYRYKINVRIIDDTGLTSLVLFDDMVHKLLDEMSCWKMMEHYLGAREDIFPDEFNVIVEGFMIQGDEDVKVTTKAKEVAKVNANETEQFIRDTRSRQMDWKDYFKDLKLRINKDSNGEGSSGGGKRNVINLDDDNEEEMGAKRGKTIVVQENVEKE